MAMKSKSGRGGFLGSLLSKAMIPFSILAAQQTYRKRRSSKGTRKSKKSGKKSRRYY